MAMSERVGVIPDEIEITQEMMRAGEAAMGPFLQDQLLRVSAQEVYRAMEASRRFSANRASQPLVHPRDAVSLEFPVHVRPVEGGGLELALLCPPDFRLGRDVPSEFGMNQYGLVGRAAEAVIRALRATDVQGHEPDGAAVQR
jgi:hypothetical protein